jgi:hypothetical protein
MVEIFILETRATAARPHEALKEATMIIAIAIAAVTVVGVARTIHAVSNDGLGRVPTRTYPNMFSIR